ncbi:T-cell immunomodulatory protein [Astathelohania contejeani]|uniref:T-cell immunomodulatory protein n=1 Tax=Astathelohania contejeani TaxID=164912 RepID=A0ABQ7HWE2_9MICR|nr:T-cell immunomodulatory protein [Thelohania contejeani]
MLELLKAHIKNTDNLIDDDLKGYACYTIANVGNEHKNSLICIDKNRTTLVAFTYSNENKKFIKEVIYEEKDGKIYTVYASTFDSVEYMSYVIVLQNSNDIFQMKLVKSGEENNIDLPDSEIVPLLYSDDNSPSLFIKTTNGYSSLTIKNGKCESRKFPNITSDIERNHNGAFVDVTGLSTNLIFTTQNTNKGRCIEIYALNSKDLIKLSELEIPKKTGPMVFADIRRNGRMDLVFVSHEDNKYYLNIYYNTGDTKCPFKEENDKYKDVYDLTKLFPGFEPITDVDVLGNIPAGLVAIDLDLNSYPDFVLIMKNKTTEKTFIRVLENNEGKLIVSEKWKELEEIDGAISVGVLDIYGLSEYGIFVNNYLNGDFHISYFDSTYAWDNFRLQLVTLQSDIRAIYRGVLPGVSYRLYLRTPEMVLTGTQMPQRPFLSPHIPGIFFGLGSLNVMIEKLVLRLPDGNTSMEVSQIIIPNSELVLRISNNDVDVELFLNIWSTVRGVSIVLFTVLLINFMLVVWFYLHEKKKQKKAMKKDSMLFNFEAL